RTRWASQAGSALFPAAVGPAITVTSGAGTIPWSMTPDMPEAFVQDYRARWADMDFNQHMRNAAYHGWGEETRMRFLDAHGFGMGEFERLGLGPVVVED